jgi:DNA-binding response OmpR family regulator
MAKIFVIEDDESIRELVKVALQGYGHEFLILCFPVWTA